MAVSVVCALFVSSLSAISDSWNISNDKWLEHIAVIINKGARAAKGVHLAYVKVGRISCVFLL